MAVRGGGLGLAMTGGVCSSSNPARVSSIVAHGGRRAEARSRKERREKEERRGINK
jgi:hypothetical protein